MCDACTYLVSVSEPSGPLLLAAHESNPLVTAAAQTLPDVRVSIHAPRLERLLEGAASRGADTVGERLVVPVGRVLEDQPSSGLADTAPALALVAMSTDPPRGIQVALESQVLLSGHHVGVGGVHVFLGRGFLLLVESTEQVRGLGQLSEAAVEGMSVSVALEHSEETV